MKFFKFLFWFPVLLILIVFASYNSQMVDFNLWPFMLEAKVSGSLAMRSGPSRAWCHCTPLRRFHAAPEAGASRSSGRWRPRGAHGEK